MHRLLYPIVLIAATVIAPDRVVADVTAAPSTVEESTLDPNTGGGAWEAAEADVLWPTDAGATMANGPRLDVDTQVHGGAPKPGRKPKCGCDLIARERPSTSAALLIALGGLWCFRRARRPMIAQKSLP